MRSVLSACARPFFVVLIVAGFRPSALAQSNYQLRPEDTPVCTEQQLREWEFARDNTLGVVGLDPAGHRIGPYAAIRRYPNLFAGRNWYPVDGDKHTFCGTVSRFEFYDKPFTGENDWNIYIIPTNAFEYIIKDVLSAFPRAAGPTPDCDGGTNNCAVAEIQPHRSFFENEWFRRSDDSTSLAGRTLCSYGPWIREEAHSNHPEIHPPELLWWSSNEPQAEWWLMILQDSSERFHRPNRYAVPRTRPDWWRPWAQFPRTGVFKLGFEFKVGEAAFDYDIFDVEGAAHNIVTWQDPEASKDVDDGPSHALVYEGKVALRVRERQRADDDVGVRFDEVCRDAEGARVRGYITLTIKVGLNDKGGEGYGVLRVVKGAGPSSLSKGAATQDASTETLPAQTQSAPPPFAPVSRSLRRVVINGRPTLVGDVELQTAGSAKEASRSEGMVVQMTTEGSRRALPVASRRASAAAKGQRARGAAVVVEGVPVLSEGNLEIKTGQEAQSVEAPRVALAPEATTQAGAARGAQDSALETIVRAAGSEMQGAARDVRPVEVQRWEVEAMPAYAPARDGRVVREDSSVFSEELNDAARDKNAARRRELFGSAQPFKIEWSFAATDLATGAQVPVRVGQLAAPGEIQVELLAHDAAPEKIKVVFPAAPPGSVYELVATAKVTDSYGTVGTVEQRMWSHLVEVETKGRSEEQVLSATAALAGLRAEEWKSFSARPSAPAKSTEVDAQARRARMFRTLTAQATDDERLTVDELRSLVRIANMLKGKD